MKKRRWQFWKSSPSQPARDHRWKRPFGIGKKWLKLPSLRLPKRKNQRAFRGPGPLARLLSHRLFLVAAGITITLGSIAYYPVLIDKWPLGYVVLVRWAEPFIEIFGGALVAIGVLVRGHWGRMRWARTIGVVLIISAAATYTYHHLSETGQIEDWLDRITRSDSAPGLVQQQVPTLANTLRGIDTYLVEAPVPQDPEHFASREDIGIAGSNERPTTHRDGLDGPERVWVQGSYVAGARGQPIVLVDNPGARNPSWDQLTGFLKHDSTDRKPYLRDSFVCADFAQMLHNNAEEAGWRAAYVVIQLGPSPDNPYPAGHALNAFETTDRGLVFIDSTSVQSAYGPANADKIVDFEVGQDYVPQSVFPEEGWSSTWVNMGRVEDIRAIQW